MVVAMGIWRRVKRPQANITGRRLRMLMPCFGIFAIVVPIVYFNYHVMSYFMRPLWDSPPKPFQIIPHYHAEGIPMAKLCKLHGWTERENPRRIFDAVIFSNEVDILEIRMRELMPFVTKFLVMESNATFTGQRKPLYFKENESRYNFAQSKLQHLFLPSRRQKPNENPFVNERYHREAMERSLVHAGMKDGDLLITADVDEIPSAHTILLLQHCDGYPTIMHLQLRNYIYSFEFLVDHSSWRSSVQIFSTDTPLYKHVRKADHLLADAGWHCSFCFRRISDFVFKMQAYSHADRIRSSSFLVPERIQGIICKGTDIFDMLPEEFTFKELIGKLGAVPRSLSGVYLPRHLLENAESYRYLLPGNCMREANPASSTMDQRFA